MVWCLMVWLLPHQMKRYHSTRLGSHSCVHLLLFVVHMHRLFLYTIHTPLIHSQEWNENPVINTSTIPLHGVYCGIFHSLFQTNSSSLLTSSRRSCSSSVKTSRSQRFDPNQMVICEDAGLFFCVSRSLLGLFCVVQELHSISCLLFSFQFLNRKRQKTPKKFAEHFST